MILNDEWGTCIRATFTIIVLCLIACLLKGCAISSLANTFPDALREVGDCGSSSLDAHPSSRPTKEGTIFGGRFGCHPPAFSRPWLAAGRFINGALPEATAFSYRVPGLRAETIAPVTDSNAVLVGRCPRSTAQGLRFAQSWQTAAFIDSQDDRECGPPA